MQTVSEKWKNAHKQPVLNESFVEVSLGIGDPDALADAQSRDNGAVYISDSPQIVSEVDKNIVPYCTLEQNLWLLDGEREAIPESNYGDCGYIGDALSDDTCVFSTKIPVITIDFTKLFIKPIPGITITWSATYGEFADNFIVSAYDGNSLIAQKEVIDNRSVTTSVWLDITEYNRIEIQIKKWCLPYHRARIEEVFVGIHAVYSKKELFSYSHKQSVDPISTSLPKSEISFSIGNANGEYNPYNNSGISKYLIERQEVKTRYGLRLDDNTIEWIKGGTFYLSEWYAKQNGLTADFSARDLLEFMSSTYVDEYDLSFERSFYDLAEQILIAADLPLNDDGSVKWHIDNYLKSITTVAPIPKDTLANCLQLIANATGCTMYQDREGILRIERLAYIQKDYSIDSFKSYSKPEVSLSKPIKQVVVKVYSYQMGERDIESTTSEITYTVSTLGETIVVDNPLITDDALAYGLAQTVGVHLKPRMTIDTSWRADVRLDALDVVTNDNDYDTKRVCMTDVEYRYNGAFRATGKGKVIGNV